MSAEKDTMRRLLRSLLLVGLSGGAAYAETAVDAPPEPEFLEYLGSWEGSDEDWLMLQGAGDGEAATDARDASETTTGGDKESTEDHDEG